MNQISTPAPIINLPAPSIGQTVGIFAPSSSIDETRFNAGIALLHKIGFKTKIHPQTYHAIHQSAGTPEQKADALHDLFKDSDVDFIMAACGGNRAALMLPHLDFNLIREHAKPLGGFSDVTILLNALYARAGITSLHMPTVQNLTRVDEPSIQSFTAPTSDLLFDGATILKTGNATGTLLGGTLSVLCAMIGTNFVPDYKNALLFIEDVNEEFSRIDRMLWQLSQALPFDHLAGIIIGEFLNPEDTGRPFGFTLNDIIAEHTAGLNIPIITNAPIGHGTRNITLPFGHKLTLNAHETGITVTKTA